MKSTAIIALLIAVSISAAHAQPALGVECGSVSLGSAYADGAPFAGGTAVVRTTVLDPRLTLGCVLFGVSEWLDGGAMNDLLVPRPYASLAIEKPFQALHPRFQFIPGLDMTYTLDPLREMSLDAGIALAAVSLRIEWRFDAFSLGAFVEPGLARYDAGGLTTILDGSGLPSLRFGAVALF